MYDKVIQDAECHYDDLDRRSLNSSSLPLVAVLPEGYDVVNPYNAEIFVYKLLKSKVLFFNLRCHKFIFPLLNTFGMDMRL